MSDATKPATSRQTGFGSSVGKALAPDPATRPVSVRCGYLKGMTHPEMTPREFAHYDPDERRDMDAGVCRAALAAVSFLRHSVSRLSEYHQWWACEMCPTAVDLDRDGPLSGTGELQAWLADLEGRLGDELDGLPEGHPTRPRHADVIAARNAVVVLKGAVADAAGGYTDADIDELMTLVSPASAGRGRGVAETVLETVRDEVAESLPLPA